MASLLKSLMPFLKKIRSLPRSPTQAIMRYVKKKQNPPLPELSPPTQPTAEELLPTPTPTPELEKKSRLANIQIKNYDPSTKLYEIVSGGKIFKLTADQLRIRAQFPESLSTGPPEARIKAKGDFAEVLKNREVGKDALLKWAKNLETEELREKYRSEIEKLGDVEAVKLEDLPPIFQNSAILQSMFSDISGTALGTGATAFGAKAAGAGIFAGPIALATAGASLAGSWQKGTAKGSASTTSEALSQFRASYTNIEKMKMNLRRGEPTGAVDSEGNALSPVEAFNQEYSKILQSEAVLKRSYDDGYFNLETSVGKEYQKVVGWRRFELGHMQEFAAAMAAGAERGGPEYGAEYPETGENYYSEAMTETG